MKVAALQMVSATTVEPTWPAPPLLAQAAEPGPSWPCCPSISAGPARHRQAGLPERRARARSRTSWPARRAAGLWIVGGTLPLATGEPERVRNSSLVWSPSGERGALRQDPPVLLRQRARALRRIARAAGRHSRCASSCPRATATLARRPVGLLRPALSRAVPRLCAQGADLLLVPSAFTPPPARRTGSCCCAPAPSRTWPMCWRRPRAACTRTAAAPGATDAGRPLGPGAGLQAQGASVVLGELDAPQLTVAPATAGAGPPRAVSALARRGALRPGGRPACCRWAGGAGRCGCWPCWCW
jgi:nitrilase